MSGKRFLTGVLKEAGEVGKRKPEPATTGTSQRSAERQGGMGRVSEQDSDQAGQALPGPSLQSTVIREVTGHI